MDNSIKDEVTAINIEEAITQEIYIQVGFKTAVCLLLLTTGAEVVGTYTAVSSENIKIAVAKQKAREAALQNARIQLEAIATWKLTLAEIRKQREEAENEAKAQSPVETA